MKKIFIIILYLIGFLLVLEGGGRWLRWKELNKFQEEARRSLYRTDKRLGYSMKPDFTIQYGGNTPVKTSSLGWRGREIPRGKADGVLRVICIGDSRTFGLGLAEKDTFPRQLEKTLRERFPDRSVEVINAGVPGYTTREGVILLREILPPLQPDIVIAAFGHNDRWRSPHREAEIAALLGTPPPIYGWGISTLLKKIDDLLDRIPLYLELKVRLRRRSRKTVIAPERIEEEFKTNVPLEEYRENLKAMAREAIENGFIFIPFHLTENPAVFDRTEKAAELLAGGKPEEAERELNKIIGIPVNFSPAPYYYLGLIYRRRGEEDRAEEAFRIAEFGARVYPHPLRIIREIFRRRGITEREFTVDELKDLPAISDPYYLIREYRKATGEVADDAGTPSIILGKEAMTGEMFLDADHPNPEGCRFISQQILKLPLWEKK